MQTNSSDVCVDSSPPSRKSKDGVLKLHDSCSTMKPFIPPNMRRELLLLKLREQSSRTEQAYCLASFIVVCIVVILIKTSGI